MAQRHVAAIGLVLVLALGLVAGPARAEDGAVAPADAAAIRSVIQAQWDAFRRDDGAAAFGLASPGIQAQFGDAGTFMDMVRRGYQPVYRPRSTAFGVLERSDGQIVQHVRVVGPDGGSRDALYFMEREPDGKWRIAGCMLVDSPEVGA